MSSPFDTFRKHRTFWMAGLVLLAILAFVVAPAIESFNDMLRNSAGTSNEVVVRWSDGKITAGMVSNVRTQHLRTKQFLNALALEVIKNGGQPQVPGFRYDTNEKRIEDLGLPSLTTSQNVCRTILINHRAKQLGIDFDDQVVEDFIGRFCDRKISAKRFQEVMAESVGRDLTKAGLYRQLALELSAVVMERIALAGVNYEGNPLVTPGSFWQNYLKLNQAARVEAYPVLTSEFVKQVKESPSDSEIRSLYEAGAMVFPSDENPDPGFRRYYQANVEYVYGGWNKLIEAEKTKLTPAELQAEYDRLVGLGGLKVPIETQSPAETSTTPQASQPEAGQPPAPSSETPAPEPPAQAPQPENPQPAVPQPAVPQPEAPQPEAPQPEAPQPEVPKPEVPKPEVPKPEAPQPEAPQPEAPQPEAPKQSQRSSVDPGVRLVSFQQDGPAAQPPAVESTPAETTPASSLELSSVSEPQPPAQTPPASDAPAATEPTTTEPTTTEPTATEPTATEPTTTEPTATPPSGVTPPETPAEPPMRTRTFEEAKDDIARSLAMAKVRDQLDAKMVKVSQAMTDYSTALQLKTIQEEAKQKTEEVKKLDLKKLAEDEGLSYGISGMGNGYRLRNTPVGKSTIGNQALVNVVMSPSVELYQPIRSSFIDMSNMAEPDFQEFVSWKTEQIASYTPSLSEVRDEVIEAWKTLRARDLARVEAEKLADKLRKAGDQPWSSTLDTQQQTLVINPVPFTWMSAPREMFAPPELTFVQGLDSVGQEFMQSVFNANAGQFVIAPNQGKTTYYVVRVVELTPGTEELQKNFEVSRGRARQLAFAERERIFFEWYQNIERTLNVQWLASEQDLMN